MTVSPAKKQANKKWDAENMTNLAIKIRKTYAQEIRAACAASGVTPAGIMRAAIDEFMTAYRARNGSSVTGDNVTSATDTDGGQV